MKRVLQPLHLQNVTKTFALGDDHFYRFTRWAPDLSINPQYVHLAHLLRIQPVVGAIITHRCAASPTGWHEGAITFATDLTDAWKVGTRGPRWDVLSWEPLTLAPSLQSSCGCRDHGFIIEGKWRGMYETKSTRV